MRKPVKLAIFNVAFVIITILLFSEKGFGLGFDPGLGALKFALSISVALFGVLMFFFINYMIFIMPDKVNYKFDKLETIDDCIGALYQCMRTDPAFKSEITKAIEQLETLKRRKESLLTLLEQNGVSENFRSLHQTAHKAEFYAICNVKSIISRLIVFDNKEYISDPDNVDINSHKEFIHEALDSTQLLLKEYSDLLLAVTAIDTHHVDLEDIRDMTKALNIVLKRDEFKPFERAYNSNNETNQPINQ